MRSMHTLCSARSRLVRPVAGLLLMWLAGCADDAWKAETVAATGTVTVNGEVPAGAIVRLHPVGEAVDQRGSRPTGVVGPDGIYTLTTYDFGDGAPPGDYVFTLYWPQQPELGGMSPDRLGNVYATPKTSEFKISITTDTAVLSAIDIAEARIIEPTAKTASQGPPLPGRPGPASR